jgi:protein SCO1/2
VKGWFLAALLVPLVAGIAVLGLFVLRRTDATAAGPAGAEAVVLTDQDGQPRRLADFHGRVVLLYFGYTFCPDVCPTELGWVARVVRALGSDGAAVAPVFVTVDPARDRAAVLKNYVPLFQDHLTGLTGDATAITALSDAYGVIARREPIDPGKPDGPYLITHTSTVYVLDRDGHQVGTMGSRDDVAASVARLRALITQGALPPAR